MKRLVLLMGILVMTMGLAKAQDVKETENGPKIEFDKMVHDYGEVQYNANEGYVECEFRFTNTGDEPLYILQQPRSTCGCTVPSWPKEGVNPGESEVIKVKYRSTKVGNINKDISVVSNASNTPNITLHITGKVLPQAQESFPENNMGVGAPVNNN